MRRVGKFYDSAYLDGPINFNEVKKAALSSLIKQTILRGR